MFFVIKLLLVEFKLLFFCIKILLFDIKLLLVNVKLLLIDVKPLLFKTKLHLYDVELVVCVFKPVLVKIKHQVSFTSLLLNFISVPTYCSDKEFKITLYSIHTSSAPHAQTIIPLMLSSYHHYNVAT